MDHIQPYRVESSPACESNIRGRLPGTPPRAYVCVCVYVVRARWRARAAVKSLCGQWLDFPFPFACIEGCGRVPRVPVRKNALPMRVCVCARVTGRKKERERERERGGCEKARFAV